MKYYWLAIRSEFCRGGMVPSAATRVPTQPQRHVQSLLPVQATESPTSGGARCAFTALKSDPLFVSVIFVCLLFAASFCCWEMTGSAGCEMCEMRQRLSGYRALNRRAILDPMAGNSDRGGMLAGLGPGVQDVAAGPGAPTGSPATAAEAGLAHPGDSRESESSVSRELSWSLAAVDFGCFRPNAVSWRRAQRTH